MLSPELSLLVNAGRYQLFGDDFPVYMPEGDVDWRMLADAARRHAFFPYLYLYSRHRIGSGVPPASMADIRSCFHENARRNLLLTRCLVDTCRLLEMAGIMAVPFKGPVLAEKAYGDFSLRVSKDIDLFVAPDSAMAAAEHLLVNGYYLSVSQIAETGATDPTVMMATNGELRLIHPRSDFEIEIHPELTTASFHFRLPMSELLERVEPRTLPGGNVYSFSSGDLVLILCVHGVKHRWERLGWVLDAAALMRGLSGDEWDKLLSLSKCCGGKRVLLSGAKLAQELFAIDLPANIKTAAAGDKGVVDIMMASMKRLNWEIEEKESLLPSTHFFYKARERRRDRFHYGLRLLLRSAAPDSRN